MNPPPSLLHVSLKDFFSFEVLKLALIPLIVTMVVLYLLFFSTTDYLLTQMHPIELEAQNPSGGKEGLLAWALRYSFTSWIASILLYTIGIVAVMYLSIFTTLLIVGFMTPRLVEIVRRRHYPQEQTHGFGKEEFALRMRTQGATIRLHTLWMYLTTLIPFGALFAMLFYVLFLSHFYFRARLQSPSAPLIEAAH